MTVSLHPLRWLTVYQGRRNERVVLRSLVVCLEVFLLTFKPFTSKLCQLSQLACGGFSSTCLAIIYISVMGYIGIDERAAAALKTTVRKDGLVRKQLCTFFFFFLQSCNLPHLHAI